MFRSIASHTIDPKQVAATLRRELDPSQLKGMLLFVTAGHASPELAETVTQVFDVPVFGCTAASVIGNQGVMSQGFSAVAFYGDELSVDVQVIEPLTECGKQASMAARRLRAVMDGAPQANGRFALLLSDGLSGTEERLTAVLHATIPGVPLVGGSSSDWPSRERARVLANGTFAPNRAVAAVVTGPFRCRTVHHHSFTPASKPMVVTASSPDRRIVHELDGELAARRYCEMTKLESAELKTALVYDHPLLVRRGEHEFVRAIQSSGGRGELNLHCALHDGEVVRLGRSVEPSHQLAEEFRRLHDDLGSQRWDICIGFDSILRRLAFERSGSLAAVEAIYIKEKMVGLHTYGEQINGHHVNYSVTGVAIVHD